MGEKKAKQNNNNKKHFKSDNAMFFSQGTSFWNTS
jgi:hypothetical protein